MGEKIINLLDENGVARPVPESEVQYRLDRGWRAETAQDAASRASTEAHDEVHGGVVDTLATGAGSLLSAGTFGATDALRVAIGGEDARRDIADSRAAHPVASTVGAVGAMLTPWGAGGVAARAGQRAAGLVKGSGVASKIGGAAVGAATEGVVTSIGTTVSERSLSDNPLDVERALTGFGSNALFSGVTSGLVGGATKTLGHGLGRAKAKLDDLASRPAAGAVDDVTAKAATVDDLTAYRATVKDANPWAAIDEGGDAALLSKTNNRIRKLMDDPAGLAENPKLALKALREQETAFTRTLANREEVATRLASANKKISKELGDELATLPDKATEVVLTGKSAQRYGAFADVKVSKVDKVPTVKIGRDEALNFKTALDEGKVLGQGQQSLDKLQGLADANRALQAKITAATAKPVAAAAGKGLMDVAGDSAMGYMLGAAAGIPGLGLLAAGARVAAPLIKKLGLNSQAAAARASKGVQAFLDVGGKVAPAAPVLATKVLASVAYAPSRQKQRQPAGDAKPRRATLAASYKARADEIRSQIAPAPDGSLQMRPSARAQIADRLAPIAAADPMLADKMETLAARRLEFLASKLPKRPDVGGIPTGPDNWQPSDMEMRTFARYAAAVEDPHAIVDRLADGSVTPEDSEAMRAVYPEMYADIQRQIIESLPSLRESLPYQRRLAMSIFSNVAVDPALDPRVLAVLQGTFANEEGSEGGTEAPKAAPQFGSVSKPQGTPAQERQAG